jgi:hypothetical protein
MQGEGTYIWPDGSHYKGSFKNYLRNGYGVFTFPNKSAYKGEWTDGK